MNAHAAIILEQMKPDRGYEPSELKGFVPELSVEGLREVMHELWIARQLERVGYSGWRRVRSVCGPHVPDSMINAVNLPSANIDAPGVAPSRNGTVRPEDLFDHDSFGGWFK